MPIPDYQSLMLPVLLAAAANEVRVRDVVEALGVQLGLTPDERSALLPSGKETILNNRVHWAKTYLGKAGLIESTRRGHYKVTARGEQVIRTNPSKIDNGFLSRFEGFKQFKEHSARSVAALEDADPQPSISQLEAPVATPDEIMRVAYRQIETSLAQELLTRIVAAPADFFERLIVNLLLNMGFGGGSAAEAGRALGGSGDNGVDGVIDQDALGLDQVYIQAKRFAPGNSVGSGAIRDFFGSLDRHKATKGLFVTTSTFSTSAQETAKFLSKRIVLIDGEQLAKLMIRHNVGCRIEETLHIKKVDEDFFE